MVIAYQWAMKAMVVAVEMVAPGLLGLAADRYAGTVVVFALLGFGGGLALGIWHLLNMAKQDKKRDSED